MADSYVDYIREKEKRLLCTVICLLLFVALAGISPRARFYTPYFGEGQLFTWVICLAALVAFLGMMLLLIGTAKRGRKLMKLKETRSHNPHAGGYVSVSSLASQKSEYDVQEKKCRRLHIAAAVFGIAAVFLFAILFAAGDLRAFLTELGKPQIERSASDFRMWANLIGKFFSLLGICLMAMSAARIMENRGVPFPILYLCIGSCVLGAVQIAYFYFGDIFVYPPIADLAMLLILACCAALCCFSVFTERKKAQLSAIGNQDYYVYEF